MKYEFGWWRNGSALASNLGAMQRQCRATAWTGRQSPIIWRDYFVVDHCRPKIQADNEDSERVAPPSDFAPWRLQLDGLYGSHERQEPCRRINQDNDEVHGYW